MAYNHGLYLKNCKQMIRLNQEQVDKHLELYKKIEDPREKRDMAEEIQGWQRWVDIWKQRLAEAQAVKN